VIKALREAEEQYIWRLLQVILEEELISEDWKRRQSIPIFKHPGYMLESRNYRGIRPWIGTPEEPIGQKTLYYA